MKNLKTNKKAQFGMTQLIVVVLAVLLMFALIPQLWKIFQSEEDIEKTKPTSAILCASRLDKTLDKVDGDGYPDDCDNCVCADGCRNYEYDVLTQRIVNSRDDSDEDGKPDTCDLYPNDPKINEWSTICEDNLKETKSGEYQCVLP